MSGQHGHRIRKALSIVVAGAFVIGTGVATVDAREQRSGSDLSGWKVVVGDGVWTASGQAPVSTADIATEHHGTHSELQANVRRRGVMAHNITYTAMSNLDRLESTHRSAIEFRLPAVPSIAGEYKVQTLEIGLFVWDGADTRLDYGLAMQWVLNPWVSDYGALRVWRNTARGPRWERVGYLEPDAAWHKAEFDYRPNSGVVRLRIDDQRIEVSPTTTPKPDSWGNTIGARFQVEIVSLWPGERSVAPMHRAEFRDWTWTTAN